FSRNGVPASCGKVRSVCRLMRQAMSASRGSSGVHKPRPNMPHSHSGASASTMSTPNERADRDGRGGEINSPPYKGRPSQAGNYASIYRAKESSARSCAPDGRSEERRVGKEGRNRKG